MSLRRPRALRQAAFVVLACLAGPAVAFPQTTSATVSGSVKDPQGQGVPDATVVLTSESQGTAQSTATDTLGVFLFAYVRPDTYSLTISREHFQTTERTGLVVNANDRIAVGTFTLAIGVTSDTITVRAPATGLQTKSGERGFALQPAAMQNIGIAGRSVFGFAALVPGVVPNADAPQSVDAFNVNGQRSSSNNVTIDGVANIDTGNNGANMVLTNLDAVAEIKILTSSYQAEYGRSAGGQVQMVTKSGTRNFSGSAYWYGRRSDWNANTWLNNRDGTPKERSSRNDQGYSLGGPVYIPGLFNERRDTLFFFWNQEFQRRKDPVAERRVTVPTAIERAGDFSQSVDASGNPYPFIRDHATGLPCNATNTSGCFKYQGVLGRIDPARLYAPTLAALSLYPLPNVVGEKGYNYKSQEPSNQPIDQSLLRIDYAVSANWRVSGRYMWHRNLNENPYASSANVPTADGRTSMPGYNWASSITGILNATTSIEVSLGGAHNAYDSSSGNANLRRTAAGMADLPMLSPGVVQDDMVPTFTYGGGRIGNPVQIGTTLFPFRNFNTTVDLTGTVTKAAGSHALEAGIYVQRSRKDQSTTNHFNGLIAFANDSGNQYDTSHPFANAALGVYQQVQQPNAYLVPSWRYTNVEWYLQDNWKAVGNLTIDCGVRFYLLTPQHDSTLAASNWLPDRWDAGEAVRLYRPAVVNGARVGYDAMSGTSVLPAFIGRVVAGSGDRFNGTVQAGKGASDTLTDGNKFRVSPRAGFAYDISGRQRLIARGGFALLYDRPQGNQVFGLITNPPGMQVQAVAWGLVRNLTTASVPDPAIVLSPSEYDWKVPTVYQWNAGLQMRLPWDLMLDVAYVGAKSMNLLQFRNLNAVPYGAAYAAQNQDPTRGQPCVGCAATSPLPGGNALPADFLRPYPGYANIGMWEFGAYSDYRALQAAIGRRLMNGVMFNGFYVWSSAKGIGGSDYDYARIDGKDREANYGPLSFDRPHVVVANFVYQVPAVTAGRFLGLLVNGWQLSGGYRWIHGSPYTPGFTIAGGSITSVNMTGSHTEGARVALTGKPISSGWSADAYRQFDLAAFTVPQPGSAGLESPRYTMYLPPTQSLDLSVSKSIPLGGRRRLELRVDAFNALNLVNFTAVNSTIFFRSLTDATITNLPFDAAGTLVNKNGVGTISAVGAPRQLQLMARFSF